MTTNLSPETFISRYRALVQDDMLGNTASGNPQPAVVSPAFAYVSPDPKWSRTPPGRDFYRNVNKALAAADQKVVAFPTALFGNIDVCVMDKQLFISLMDGTVQDDEAKILMDHAPSNTLAFVRRITQEEKPDGEPLH